MKREERGKERQPAAFRRIQGQVAMILAGIIVMMTVFEMVVILNRTEQTLRRNAMDYIAADARQLEININAYLLKIEQTASLMFADEAYYAFDGSDESIDEYDRIQAQKVISDRISEIGLTANFSDFGVVYANDDTVGWISQVTAGMYPDGGMYDAFAASITDEQKQDGWSFGYQGKYDRLYYVKRLNPNAILIVSFYSHELESLFEQPSQLQYLTVRFTDPDLNVFFSSSEDEIGKPLAGDIAALTGESSTQTVMNAEYLVTTNICRNGWYLVCSATAESVLSDSYALRYYVIGISAAAAALFLALGLIFYRRMTAPMGNMVKNLNRKASSDQLSKVANKMTFEEMSVERIAKAQPGNWVGIVMIDLDRFKTINDTCGHTFGDSVIERMGKLLQEEFYDEAYLVGRVGGDEFALNFVYSKEEGFLDANKRIQEDLGKLREHFDRTFAEDQTLVPVSFSAGTAMTKVPEKRRQETGAPDKEYRDLYQRADNILYKMKSAGRGRTGFEWEN